jgi:hypothetical protein
MMTCWASPQVLQRPCLNIHIGSDSYENQLLHTNDSFRFTGNSHFRCLADNTDSFIATIPFPAACVNPAFARMWCCEQPSAHSVHTHLAGGALIAAMGMRLAEELPTSARSCARHTMPSRPRTQQIMAAALAHSGYAQH